MQTPVVQVHDMRVSYKTRKGTINAVRGASFEIQRGETLGLVGESGCGKSTVAFGLINYLGRNGQITSGQILYQGQSLLNKSEQELRKLRGNQISMVFQDAMTSLNPVLTIGQQMSEVLTVHHGISQSKANVRITEILHRVSMPDPHRVLNCYPHQISGGQQQRIVIAMAMLNNPSLLIMDEPTTALDVTIEATILDLIADLRRDFDTAILFISHNLGVIARVSDRIAVMYAGEIVETASAASLFARPQHPYTQGLLRCLPRLDRTKQQGNLHPIRGRLPSPHHLPAGCCFEPRCDYARDECRAQIPRLRTLQTDEQHITRCLFSEDIKPQHWLPPEPQDDTNANTNTNPIVQNHNNILELRSIKTHYRHASNSLLNVIGLGEKEFVKAVDGVSFQVPPGITLGIVGESGCGKSTLVKTIIGLETITSGGTDFLGCDISMRIEDRPIKIIRELQMVFQNPDATMNPLYSVGKQIERSLRLLGKIAPAQQRDEVIRLLRAVKLDEHYFDRLPSQLSGGEKQRIGIARAFAANPALVLCDEPVSALDVSVQAAVLNLLLEMQQQHGTTLLFIAHDLSVVRYFSDYIAVMYLGQIVEFGRADSIYQAPNHPYTEALIASIPIPDPLAVQNLIRLDGAVPSALTPPSGCRFHTRCPRRSVLPGNGIQCETQEPPCQNDGPQHRIYCHIPIEQLRNLPSGPNMQINEASHR